MEGRRGGNGWRKGDEGKWREGRKKDGRSGWRKGRKIGGGGKGRKKEETTLDSKWEEGEGREEREVDRGILKGRRECCRDVL